MWGDVLKDFMVITVELIFLFIGISFVINFIHGFIP
jgi:hypothetical protein